MMGVRLTAGVALASLKQWLEAMQNRGDRQTPATKGITRSRK